MSHIARCPICFAEYDGTKRETDALAKKWTKRVRADNSRDADQRTIQALAEMEDWADRLGTVAKNIGALNRTVALDAAIKRSREVRQLAEEGRCSSVAAPAIGR